MLDAIQASTPEWEGKIERLHYCLPEEFDKFFDTKYMFEEMPAEMVAEFNEMHEKAKPAILEELIRVHKAVRNGEYEPLDFKDSYREPFDVKELVKNL